MCSEKQTVSWTQYSMSKILRLSKAESGRKQQAVEFVEVNEIHQTCELSSALASHKHCDPKMQQCWEEHPVREAFGFSAITFAHVKVGDVFMFILT